MANRPSVETYGWRAVPRSSDQLFASASPADSLPINISDIPFPSTPLVKKVQEYAKEKLPIEVYNHSMRVYYYGMAMQAQHMKKILPSSDTIRETYALASLLHDIGTTEENMKSTRLSFELHGAMIALRLLKELGAPDDQAELVAEAINRHQDLGKTGCHAGLTGIIVGATVFDNVGLNEHLIHKDTIDNVVGAFPRKNWTDCFAATLRQEIGLKPWCHTTVIDRFADQVEANKLMEPWDSTT